VVSPFEQARFGDSIHALLSRLGRCRLFLGGARKSRPRLGGRGRCFLDRRHRRLARQERWQGRQGLIGEIRHAGDGPQGAVEVAVVDRLGAFVQYEGLGPLPFVLDRTHLSALRERALGDDNIVTLKQSSLAEFERGDRTVVLIDCQEFGLESVCPDALSFEQEVERAAAGQELLESRPELYRRRLTLGSLSADQLVEFDQVGILLAEELVRTRRQIGVRPLRGDAP